ncbi:hypothetical protein M5D96_007345 [Drosophila gunungcola]|uniref:Uncharacterized protein n=2 Tax=Drosophila gunungcola TaxID=103775 RepID=A0A9Q0BQ94_9MUSC|nr:hypothetical protein M5D96_007345 [Drosophila gunungcola]
MPVEAAEVVAAKLTASKTEVSAPPATSSAAASSSSTSGCKAMPALNYQTENTGPSTSTAGGGGGGGGGGGAAPADSKYVYPAASFANIPQKMLRQLIQTGHLQLHAEEDGNQYVTIPLSSTAANLIKSNKLQASGGSASGGGSASKSDPSAEKPLTIKQEYD